MGIFLYLLVGTKFMLVSEPQSILLHIRTMNPSVSCAHFPIWIIWNQIWICYMAIPGREKKSALDKREPYQGKVELKNSSQNIFFGKPKRILVVGEKEVLVMRYVLCCGVVSPG